MPKCGFDAVCPRVDVCARECGMCVRVGVVCECARGCGVYVRGCVCCGIQNNSTNMSAEDSKCNQTTPQGRRVGNWLFDD